LAAIGLRKEKRAAVCELQKEKDQEVLRQALQHRLEQRRIKEQLEAVREEKARLDSLAIVERDRELWRLQEEARANKILQKRLRTDSGIRPRGAHKRSVATQQAIEPCAKRTLLGVETVFQGTVFQGTAPCSRSKNSDNRIVAPFRLKSP
jgi:hypothetical protein